MQNDRKAGITDAVVGNRIDPPRGEVRR